MSDSEFQNARGESSLYRCNRAGTQSSSENSDEEEEDVSPWHQKHNKYRKQKSSPMVLGSSSTMLPEVKSEPGYGQVSQRKKSNNIWGSVLTEQDLTQTLVKSAAVDKPDELAYNERNVESYNFTKKYQDQRHGLEVTDSETSHFDNYTDDLSSRKNYVSRSMAGRSIIDYEDTLDKSRDLGDLRHQIGKSNSRKRRADNGNDRHQPSSVHDRLGVKKVTTMALGEVNLTVDMESEVLSAKIAELLHEPKKDLIGRIVTHLGKDVAIRVLQATKVVEEGGGMYTLDGSRRRTSGGVYLTLMKQQPEFNKNVRRLIFVEDVQEMMKHRKEKRKKAKMRRKQQFKKQGTEGKDSKARSRSGSSSSTKTRNKAADAGEDMEDGEIKDESDKETYNIKRVIRKSRKEEFNEDSSDEFEDYYQNVSKPFNFEEELAAAKKMILEKSKSENNGQKSEVMESECNECHDRDKGIFSEMADLDSAEANVVDIDIGIDTA